MYVAHEVLKLCVNSLYTVQGLLSYGCADKPLNVATSISLCNSVFFSLQNDLLYDYICTPVVNYHCNFWKKRQDMRTCTCAVLHS